MLLRRHIYSKLVLDLEGCLQGYFLRLSELHGLLIDFRPNRKELVAKYQKELEAARK